MRRGVRNQTKKLIARELYNTRHREDHLMQICFWSRVCQRNFYL